MSPRQDEPAINDNSTLWRAVPPHQVCQGDEGSERAESWAFRSDDNEVSAWIASETDLQVLKDRFPDFRVAEFTAGEARECGNIVVRDPVESDASHVVICPTPGKSPSRIKKDAKRLASKARLL
jgi:hypothetical protein